MQLEYTKIFLKHYKKRIAKNKRLDKQFQERLQLFVVNQHSSLLKTHKLVGAKKDLHAFSVTGDIRVVYFQEGDRVVLLDVGSHNQVY